MNERIKVMARYPESDIHYDNEDNYVTGFDVTCVVGHVEFDSTGDLTPHEAAFLVIARHDNRGTFQFPMLDGRTMSVTVDYPDS